MKYKVGDKVRVRSWESMEREFGLDEDGDIPAGGECFVDCMKGLCGKVLTVESAVNDVYIMEEVWLAWKWTDEMLESAEFDWESFKDESNKIAVHCKTEEEAKDFCRKMHEHGMKWSSGPSYLEYNLWGIHREDTCYANEGRFFPISFCKERNYTILEYADYFTKEKPLIPKKCRHVLKRVNKKYKWIAKDKDHKVYVYTKEPVRDVYEWVSQGRKERIDELFPKLDYSWLSFLDCKPVNFREVLKGER